MRRAAWLSALKKNNNTNVLVFHVLEEPEFPVRAATVNERLKRPGELLHRNLLPEDDVVS